MGVVRTTLQPAFTSGELSPRMYSRPDVSQFDSGLRKLLNFLIYPQGGTYRRSGTRYVNEVENSAETTRLIPFVFSEETAYVLAFGDQNIEVYKDSALVSGAVITGTVPYLHTEVMDIKFTQSANYLYLVHPNHHPKQLSRTSDTAWTIENVPFIDGPWLDENTTDTRLIASASTGTGVTVTATSIEGINGGTGFQTTDVGRMIRMRGEATPTFSDVSPTTIQEATTLGPAGLPSGYEGYVIFSATGSNVPGGARVKVTGVTTPPYSTETNGLHTVLWSSANHFLIDAKAGPDISSVVNSGGFYRITCTTPHNYEAADTIKIFGAGGAPTGLNGAHTVSSVQDIYTFTSSVAYASGWTTGGQCYEPDAFSSLTGVTVEATAAQGWGTIASRTSTTQITIDIEEPFPSQSSKYWRLGAFSETTGYPEAVTFHQQRLFFGGTEDNPQSVWGSNTNDYVYFSPTDPEDATAVLDSNAISFTLTGTGGQVNKIKWMSSSTVLLVGTVGSEWRVWAGQTAGAITPDNIIPEEVGDNGNNGVRPIKIGSYTLFVQRSERQLVEFYYDFTIEGYRNKYLAVMNEHLIREGNGIVDIAWQNEPDQVLWLVRADGRLIGCTYMREHQIFGGHVHEMGGSFGSDSFGHVESIAVIPHPDGDQDQLWLVVKRTINGATKRYVEYMEKPHYATDEDDKSGMCFLDSSIEYNSTATTTITGLAHIEGQSVDILADGAAHPAKTVSSGQVTLDYSASHVQVGLGYDSELQTLEPEVNGETGTSQGKIGRIIEVQIRVKDSIGFLYGKDPANLDTEYFRSTSDPLDQSPPLYSGWRRFKFPDSYDRDNYLVIRQDKPYPLEILAIAPTIVKFE